MALGEDQLRQRLWAYRVQNWDRVQTLEWQKKIVKNQMTFDATPILEEIIIRFGMPIDQISYLDIGSGIGNYVLTAKKMGIKSYGIEPDKIGVGSRETAIKIACDRSEGPHTFASAVGEALPFTENYFDLITMNQILEHVQDLPRVLNEALRVLKPGGILLFNSPNYLSFYEPHYKISWLPLFPRFFANIYLLTRRRNPEFLKGINYLTRAKINRLLSTMRCHFEDDQINYFSTRLSETKPLSNKLLNSIASATRKVGMNRIAIWVYCNFFIRGLSYTVIKAKDE